MIIGNIVNCILIHQYMPTTKQSYTVYLNLKIKYFTKRE